MVPSLTFSVGAGPCRWVGDSRWQWVSNHDRSPRSRHRSHRRRLVESRFAGRATDQYRLIPVAYARGCILTEDWGPKWKSRLDRGSFFPPGLSPGTARDHRAAAQAFPHILTKSE